MHRVLKEDTSDTYRAPRVDWRVSLMEEMLISREADIRENILFRQGRGQFHVSSSGHESLAALARIMRPTDWLFSHYRDRALMLARGVPLLESALGYFAKKASSSGGRQMVSHFSDKTLNIASSATPTGLQCLPATGIAWGIKRRGEQSVVFCFIGDASTRQGEFFEAVAFAIQEKLPILFVVEDNGYGISTPTEKLTPLGLGLFSKDVIQAIDGRFVLNLADEAAPFVDAARMGHGPKILWIKLDRLSSHTASDDHTRYRTEADLAAMQHRDPLAIVQSQLVSEGALGNLEILAMQDRIKEEVKQTYLAAEASSDAEETSAKEMVFDNKGFTAFRSRSNSRYTKDDNEEWTLSGAVNSTLDQLLAENENTILFGEDIEDHKGGVFGLTKGLSTRHPGRVINSPLAEATIAGLASGLSMTGFRPIFELQFIDFIGPAFNQIVNQIATLHWRSNGQFKCPLIIYAPCGAYVGGGAWHSQTNESWLAHAPGLKVYMPSNANDGADILYNAAHGTDPAIILLPKNQFQKRVSRHIEPRLHPERARFCKQGEHLTFVAWGNCVELALEAASRLELNGVTADVIDLCSIVPCDWQAIHSSVKKTGRLVVIQEDNKTCSFGQAIISEVTTNKEVFESLYAPPQLVSREDVHIGFSRALEKAVLPDVSGIVHGAKQTLGMSHE